MTSPGSRARPGRAFDADHLPYGVFARAGEQPRVGVRIGDHVLDLAPLAAASCSTRPPCSASRRSTRSWRRAGGVGLGPRAGPELLTDQTERDLASRTCSRCRRRAATCRSRSATTSTSTPPSTTPPTSAGSSGPTRSRCCPTGSTCRSATTAAPARSCASGTDIVRPCGQRKAPAEDAPTFGPSRRLDIEAELGFVVGVPSALGERVPHRRLRRPRLRGRRAQRLVGARHPGLGVRPPRPLPRQVVRDHHLPLGHPAGRAGRARGPTCRARTPSRCDYLRVDGARRARHRDRGGARRRGGLPAAVRLDVLVAGADARPHHRQRRHASAPGTCGARARSRAPSATSAARCWSCAGAARSHSRRRARAHLPRGRRRGRCATPPPATAGGRIALGEVTGRVLPAR